jgi:hypothetical protein
VQWLEEFKARFQEFSEAADTISEVTRALCKFNSVIGSAKLAAELHQATEDRSILPYGIEWQLQKFVNGLNKGLPTDINEAKEWASDISKQQALLVRWNEDFRARFEYVEAAQPLIKRVQEALEKFRQVFGDRVVSLAIQQAVHARKEDGSVCEYGLKHELEKFTNMVTI